MTGVKLSLCMKAKLTTVLGAGPMSVESAGLNRCYRFRTGAQEVLPFNMSLFTLLVFGMSSSERTWAITLISTQEGYK